MSRRLYVFTAVFLVGTQYVPLSAWRQADPELLRFEVASVKLSDPNTRGQFQYLPGGNAIIRGVNVRLLIQQSYDVRDFQIIGGPSWLASDRYDITAKAEAPDGVSPDADAMRHRLRSLLRDRFRLDLHSETKEMARYDLVAANGGPKLKENAPPILDGRMSWGTGFLRGQQVDIRFMTVWLSRLIGQPVGDQTGLKSTYDFELQWSPESSPRRSVIGPEPDAATLPSTGPSVFTAIQEQLGLKLEPRKGPVNVLVIDHVERPMPD